MAQVMTGIRNSIGPVGAGGTASGAAVPKSGQIGEFRDKLEALRQSGLANRPMPSVSSVPLRFSNHAIERMRTRGIRFSPEQLTKIEGAIQKASAKGAKNTLLLTDNSALIVSVKDHTVVTVLDRAAMKDNVFTNIDSTVMV